ncbi:MAG: hypothetical protein IJA94_02770 [Bacilli bacterium]|nr:hypothetical protein [Bacilli bacterium]
MNKREWTSEEDQYIVDNFGKMTFSDMAKHLNCSINTVQRRGLELGFSYDKKSIRRWTEDEIELLKVMAPKYLNKTIARKLKRSVNEVNKKARQLNIKLISRKPVWKKWKIKFLSENIGKMSLTQLQKELEVNYFQLIDKIGELGLEYNTNFWNEEEEKILIELVSRVYIREIAKVLNRSEGAVVAKARQMNLDYITLKKNYSEEELLYIMENWGIIPVTEMARNLKVTAVMVRNQAKLMNLPNTGQQIKWTEEELKKLKCLASKKTITELAKYFKTTESAISTVAYHNKIILKDDKVHWTEEDNKLLKKLAQTMDLLELAKEMNRTTAAIRLQARRLNISIIPNKEYAASLWSEEDDNILINLAKEGKTLLEICDLMNKKDKMILKKARSLGIVLNIEEQCPWTEDEIKRLRELAKTKKLSELVKELNRTSTSIYKIAQKFDIEIICDRKRWTEEEYVLLEKLTMVDKKTPKEIAKILDRTEDAIIVKINRRGLQIQTNDKRYWKPEEETLLADLWGTTSYELLAKELNRSVSSIKNKAFQLGLGAAIEGNYNGLTIKEISTLLNVNINTVNVAWISLGLKCKTQKISNVKSYRYVEIVDLFEFLENNQNLWDSRNLEKNILGLEPQWLVEKRQRDIKNNSQNERTKLTKQQLLLSRKLFLGAYKDSTQNIISDDVSLDRSGQRLIRGKKNETKI